LLHGLGENLLDALAKRQITAGAKGSKALRIGLFAEHQVSTACMDSRRHEQQPNTTDKATNYDPADMALV